MLVGPCISGYSELQGKHSIDYTAGNGGYHMKKDVTEKNLSALSKKVGQAVRAETKLVKKTLLASFRREMSHVKTDARTIAGRTSTGKA